MFSRVKHFYSYMVNEYQPVLKSYFGAMVIFTIILAIIFYGIGYQFDVKELRKWITRENRILEWVGATAFLVVAIVGYVRIKSDRKLSRWNMLIPFTGAVCFLEETSFGWTIFKWYTQPRIQGKKMDSMHDFVSLGMRQGEGDVSIQLVLGLVAGLCFISLLVLFLLRNKLKALFSACPWFLYFFLSGVVMGSSMLLESGEDLGFYNIEKYGPIAFVEEALEMNAALILLFGTFLLPPTGLHKVPRSSSSAGAPAEA